MSNWPEKATPFLVTGTTVSLPTGWSLSVGSIATEALVIDATSLEALLVRKDGDAGDVFIVDTTNARVGINITPTVSLDIVGKFLITASLVAASGVEYASRIAYTVNKAAGDDYGLRIEMTDTASPGTSKPLAVAVGGNDVAWIALDGSLVLANAAGPTILNEAASTTNPTLIPNRVDLTTGIGWNTGTLVINASSKAVVSANTTRTEIVGTDFPSLRVIRDTTATSANQVSMFLVARSTGDAAAGFGTGLYIGIRDVTLTNDTGLLAAFRAIRIGADNTGQAILSAFVAGTEKTFLTAVGVANSVNNLTLTPSIATSPVLIGTEGSDANVDLKFSLKGTGNLQLPATAAVDALLAGTHTITIKDSTGTSYKLLAVVA